MGPDAMILVFWMLNLQFHLDILQPDVLDWCFWTVVLEKGPLACKEIKTVHPKGNQFWIFIGKTDAEAETPILWPPDAKNWLIWKDPDAGKNWRQEEKRMRCWMASMTQETWIWASSGSWWWGHRELDVTECLNWIDVFAQRSNFYTVYIKVLIAYLIMRSYFDWAPYK